MNPRRIFGFTLLLLGLGAFALLISLSKEWAVEPAALLEGVTPSRAQSISGTTAAPAAAAAAWIGFAAIAGVIATRSWGRIIVGVIVTLAALAGGYAVLGAWAGAWSVVAMLGLVALLVAGLSAVVWGRGWPQLGRRYERKAAEPGVEVAPTPLSDWEALDRGEDPTT